MKIYIIYASTKGRNIEEIVNIIKDKLSANISIYYKAKMQEVIDSDVVIFGSDIYFNRFHRGIIRFAQNVPNLKNKRVFVFSSTDMPISFFIKNANNNFKKILERKGIKVEGVFEFYTFHIKSFLNLFKKEKLITLSKKDLEFVDMVISKIKNNN